jgi:hypothetical protein
MNSIPTEDEWEDYSEDLDAKYAHDMFIGKSNEEMQLQFKNHALSEHAREPPSLLGG